MKPRGLPPPRPAAHAARPLSSVLAAVALWAALHAGAGAEVVLLRSGAVLAGEVAEDGGKIVVRSPGSELRLRPADVAHRAPSVAALYRWWADSLTGGAAGVENHAKLAQWCLQQRLWSEAAEQLDLAERDAPGAPRLVMLRRSLEGELAAEADRGAVLAAYNTPTAHSGIERHLSPDAPAGPGSAGIASTRVDSERSDPARIGPADAGAADSASPIVLPDGTIEHFTRRVQPILVNNCTNGGCHLGRGADSFPIDRRLLHGYADARSTQHNLRLTLAAIDLVSPNESVLIRAARGPHHDATPMSGARRAAWLAKIEEFVAVVAAANAPQIDPAASPPDPASAPQPAAQSPHAVATEAAPEQPFGDGASEVFTPRVVKGGVLRLAGPADEFDPEEFNRLYRRPVDDLPLDTPTPP